MYFRHPAVFWIVKLIVRESAGYHNISLGPHILACSIFRNYGIRQDVRFTYGHDFDSRQGVLVLGTHESESQVFLGPRGSSKPAVNLCRSM